MMSGGIAMVMSRLVLSGHHFVNEPVEIAGASIAAVTRPG
jgi:hypothetical protein